MKMEIDVSIIIPTYNRLWCLPRTIESCRHNLCRTEIIVIDDGSTDGTWEWLQSQIDIIAAKQPNQGQTWAINKGTSIARGQYLRFLDSDDLLCEGIIDKQFQAAIKTGADLVYSRVDRLNYQSGEIIESPDLPVWEDFLLAQLSVGYSGHFLGMLFHCNLVKQVPRRPDFSYREDRMFLLEVGLLKPKLSYVIGCAGYWVQHQSQMQSNYQGMKLVVANWQHLQIFKRILGDLEGRNELTIEHRKAATKGLWVLAHWIAIEYLDEACEIVEWVYQLDPDFQPPSSGISAQLYKKLGFYRTEKIMNLRRSILKMFKGLASFPVKNFQGQKKHNFFIPKSIHPNSSLELSFTKEVTR
jgi:glycosyltransferase involved in cell wall biosynthesis